MTASIVDKHNNHLEPNLYKRENQRTTFLYPTNRRMCYKVWYHLFRPIYFLKKYRGINLDNNIVFFIKDSFTNPENLVVRIITSTNSRVNNQYKKELIKSLTKHNIITQVNIIQNKATHDS